MKMRIKDLTGSSTPLPEGVYEVSVKEVKQTEYNSGSSGFTLQLKVESEEHNGRIIFDNLVVWNDDGTLSGAAFRWANFIVACLDDDVEVDMSDVDAVTDITEATTGKHLAVEVTVEPEDKNSGYKARNRIKNFMPLVA